MILVLALALVAGLSIAAYAEVQNVKISGDILISGISRTNYDLAKQAAGQGAAAAITEDGDSIFLTQTRIKVDADLTDNVSTTIRLINERNWDTQDTAAATGSNNDNIDLDLAYVTLKEFLYSPLSAKIGRQDIRFGNGLVIGNARNYTVASINGVPSDLSMKKAFDAIRLTLNYDPLVIDAVYSKIADNGVTSGITTGVNNDVNLYGMNAKYDINSKNSVEVYVWGLINSNDAVPAIGFTDKPGKIVTIGGLYNTNPIEKLKLSAEMAFQQQHNRPTVAGAIGDTSATAWAFQGMVNYDFKTKYSPTMELDYTFLGNRWNVMYYDQPGVMNNIVYTIIPYTNLHATNLKGTIKPVEDITVLANYGYYLRGRERETIVMNSANTNSDGVNYGAYRMKNEKELGSALDLTANYDYTEDVQFGLTTGWFFPGAAFDGDNNIANQVIGSMKVTF